MNSHTILRSVTYSLHILFYVLYVTNLTYLPAIVPVPRLSHLMTMWVDRLDVTPHIGASPLFLGSSLTY
jgi:hypothetical protein